LVVICGERNRLVTEYELAVLDDSAATNAILKVVVTATLADRQILSDTQEEAEGRISKARSAYEQHIIEHGCQ
jgi:hypothetical protein